MEYLTLPQTDLKVSKIALGCMRIADKNIEEVEELVKTALESGINFFDHADIYGRGKSEELFGEVLKRHPEYRKQMIIQTKCGIVPGKRYDFSKEHILKCVNESLERLHTDYVDILLLHRPDALCDPQEVAETFNELYEAGKVHYFGVSNHTPLQIELLKKYLKYPIIINQLQLSIVHSVMIDSGLNMNMKEAFAQDKDGGVLDYCRLNHTNYQKLNDVMQQLAYKYQVTKPAIAIAWLLRHPAHMQPIVGTTSSQHLKETIKACDFTLTRQEWYDLYLASEKPLP